MRVQWRTQLTFMFPQSHLHPVVAKLFAAHVLLRVPHRKHYSAERMSLVLLGGEPLDTLQVNNGISLLHKCTVLVIMFLMLFSCSFAAGLLRSCLNVTVQLMAWLIYLQEPFALKSLITTALPTLFITCQSKATTI